MTYRHVFYSLLGIFLAGVWMLAVLLAAFLVLPQVPSDHLALARSLVALQALAALLIGGGGAFHFLWGFIVARSMWAMSLGYFLTVVFFPLGLWGLRIWGEEKRSSSPPLGSH
jgi:hypothetical protein